MKTLLQDIRYALRQLRKSPAFTLTVIVDAGAGHRRQRRRVHALRPGAAAHVARRAAQGTGALRVDRRFFRLGQQLWRRNDQLLLLSHVQGSARPEPGLSRHAGRRHAPAWASPGTTRPRTKTPKSSPAITFSFWDSSPRSAACFTQQDDTAKNANPVAVLSYDYWKTRFAASRDVVGQTVLINGHPFTILGVAPENFRLRHRRLQARRVHSHQHGRGRHAVDGAPRRPEQPPVHLAHPGCAAQARRDQSPGRGQPGAALAFASRL